MKLLGQLLVWGSLAAGAMSAATGYLASLNDADDQLLGLTLAAPAGKIESPDGKVEPIAGKHLVKKEEKDEEEKDPQAKPQAEKKLDTEVKVTAELLAELRKAGVVNIRVKEFSFSRWRGKWYFLTAMAGLLIGALLTRTGAKPKAGAQPGRDTADSPQRTLEALRAAVEQLRSQLPQMPDRRARLEAIVERVGELQKTHMVAFPDARAVLVSQVGLAGYANLMDSFAAAERQLNRAWSAAADKVCDEAVSCLDEAAKLLDEVREKLPTEIGSPEIGRPR